jgi:hypothetical protein
VQLFSLLRQYLSDAQYRWYFLYSYLNNLPVTKGISH